MNKLVVIQNSIKTTCLFRAKYIGSFLGKEGKVVVIAPNDCQASYDKLVAMGCEVPNILAPTNIVRRLAAVFLMNIHILQQRFSGEGKLFVCHFLVTYLSTFFSIVPLNKKVFLSIEGLGSLYKENSLLIRLIIKIINRKNVVRIFCNSNERELVGQPDDWVAGGIGVDIDSFLSQAKRVEESPSSFTLLYVGRLIGDKGAYDAISVFKTLCQHRDDVNLVMVGDIYPNNPSSFSNDDISKLKKEFGERLTFAGYVNDPRAWYDKADVLLLPSRREGFPVCVMEASAMGVPSICFKVPGCEDAIQDNANGYLAPFGDIQAMAALTEHALVPDNLVKLRLSSREYACHHFSDKDKSSAFLSYILSGGFNAEKKQ
ncbi:Glycosyltransferase [Vibrio chagasii]|nr:Glycosyltransferase [Vibrio chagasii]